MENLTFEEMQLRDVVAIAQALKTVAVVETQNEVSGRLQYCAVAFKLMQWATRPKTSNADRAAYRLALDKHWQTGRKFVRKYHIP